ncbi:MAG: LLM class flavin-dependent oxidoreductase [Chloroflexia bacterium]|nr:LLM class flavin-dependent oxidoreductase [Chloroflexia bacterium]
MTDPNLSIASTAPTNRPIEVGLFLPPAEVPHLGCITNWKDLVAVAIRAEALGFDSLWLADHLLLEYPERDPIGLWECWSLRAALAAATSRIELGPLVSCTCYRNPALLAKMADTVEEISGGRLILGLGAGWHESEFHSFGFPYDHRVSRFEEALQIIIPLLRGELVDFEGRYHHAQNCQLRPLGPRPVGPPILIGAKGPRMMRLAATYADAWDSDFIANPTDLSPLRAMLDNLDAACREVGRDPVTLRRTASFSVNLPGHSRPDDHWMAEGRIAGKPATGSPEELAALLMTYAAEGIDRVQVWLDPNTVETIEAFATVLELLEQG